jgi:hypothetical protein
MLEVGWPDPALVLDRMESTRNCAARSRVWLRLVVLRSLAVIRSPAPSSAGKRQYSLIAGQSWTGSFQAGRHTSLPLPAASASPRGVRRQRTERPDLTAAIWHNDQVGQPVKRSLLAYDH